MIVVMMELWTTHPTQARFAHVSRSAWAHVSRWLHPCWPSRTASHVRGMGSRLNRFAIADLRHSSDSSTSQSRILIAVAPAVNSSLNQSSLSAKTRVQLCQGPTNGVAFGFIHQSIAAVLILAATSSGVNAVLSLEFWAESVNIDRFHITSDCVFHLYTVARILKGNPLNTIVVLSHDQRCCCWNWTRGSIWIHPTGATGNIVLIHLGRTVCSVLWGTKRGRWA